MLKNVHPNVGISGGARRIINQIVESLADYLATKIRELVMFESKVTITSREVQSAVRIYFPEELAKKAVSFGTKGVIN